MELKAFKGMPHEFGGIDYTEGSEVEGGEFAVQIGKSGNEYIFDKNSSEGERLSKEYKKLDKNGRLTEDDPLALEAFDQIAREEALKHAQRSVNEKGIDPFRNMYDQAGQAANGGVKYATGGPMMNPAEVPNVNPGAQYNTSMSYAPKTAEEYYRQTQGESRMRDSFGTQAMREEPTQKAFKEIGAGKEFGMLMGDIFFTPVTSAFTGKSFSEMVMEDQGYSSSDATKRAVGDDTMTGTAFGYGFAESEGVISNLGSSAFASMGDGGALKPKKKYSGGGASGWLALFEGIHNIRQTSKQIAGPAIDAETADKMGDEYVRNPIAGAPTTSGNPNINFNAFKKEGFDPETEVAFTGSGLDQEWMMDPNQTYAMPPASDTTSMVGTDVPIDLGTGSSAFGGDFGGFGGFKSGGAKPIYGYYANGGGKKKDKSYDGMKDPVQWDVMQNYIASNDTRNRMSQAAVGSGDEMYAPYRVDNTCVAGVNCFEDIAGVQGIPDDIYNNRALKKFFESKEGKKSFRKAKNEKPGDYVQFEEKIRTENFELPNGEIISIPTGQFNYPYHIGMVTGNDIYLGDGSRNNPLYYSNIYKEPSIETSNVAGIDIDYNNINPNFYRMRNKKDRQKVIDAAVQAKQQGKDVVRPVFGDEEPLYLPMQQYRKNTPYPIAGF